MSLFDVDYDVLVRQLMPVRLRLLKSLAWLKCLVAPVKSLHNLFRINREGNVYFLAHNGQVCYLEAVLNDIFDNLHRNIFISDPAYFDPIYIYEDIEIKPVYIDMDSEIGTSVISPPDPIPCYLDDEVYAGSGISFIINVPLIVYGDPGFDLNRLKALADKYKLVGRSYTVVTY